MRLKVSERQYRPLFFFGPARAEITFLFMAHEVGDKFVPKDAPQRAERARDDVVNRRSEIRELEINKPKVWEPRDPEYRNAFVSSTVAARIAVRIYNLRKKAAWTQPQLAEKAGMKQARVSVLEQGDYENFTFSTLKKLAAAFDVAVVVDFVSFPDFVKWSESINSESVVPQSFAESQRPLAEGTRQATSRRHA